MAASKARMRELRRRYGLGEFAKGGSGRKRSKGRKSRRNGTGARRAKSTGWAGMGLT